MARRKAYSTITAEVMLQFAGFVGLLAWRASARRAAKHRSIAASLQAKAHLALYN